MNVAFVTLVGLAMAIDDPTKVILDNCPNMKPFVNSPNLDGSPIFISASFRCDRLIGIDEVEESLTVIGSVGLFWNVSCLQNLTQIGKWPGRNANEPLYKLKHEDFWLPAVGLRNSISGTLSDQDFSVEIFIHPSGLIEAYYWGKYQVYCDLDFTKFPLDTYEPKL